MSAGFLSFIGPIILDGVFGGLPALGKLFGPNTLAMLQMPTISFVAIRWRKRADRAAQLAILATAFAALGRLAYAGASFALARALAGPRWLQLSAPLAATAAFALRLRQLRVGGDVADVMARQTDKKTGERKAY